MLNWISRPPHHVISALIIAASALAGIVYCIRISLRKRGTKAALSLAATLAAWLLVSAGFAALGAEPGPIAQIILFLLVFTCVIVGILLALLAFIDLRRELLPSGNNRLMIALTCVFGALALLVITFGLVQLVTQLLNSANRAASNVAIAPTTAPAATQPAAAPATQSTAIGAATRPMPYLFAYPAQSVALERYNFILEFPGDPWVRSALGGEGFVGFRRIFPFMHLSINALTLGDDVTSDSMADNASINSSPEFTVYEILDRRPLMINGIPGVLLKKRFASRGQVSFALQWLCAYQGYCYDLAVIGNAENERQIVDAAPDLLKHFYILDPTRIVRAPPIIPLHYESSEYAYKFHLELPRWKQAAEIAKYLPGADFGALSAHAHIAIFPVYLYGLNPPMEELTDALLNPRPLSVATAEALTKSRDGDAEIYSFESQQTVPIRKVFLYKSIRRGELAYLIIGSADTAAQKAELKKAMDGFALQPVPPKLSPLEFTLASRRTHSLFLNNLGLRYEGDIERAAPCFRKAMDLAPDPIILENLANVYIKNKEYQKAILTINRDIDNFRNQGRLRALIGLARGLDGDKQAAIETFRDVFKTDLEDDVILEHYLTLLVGAGNPGEAITTAENYLRRHNSLTIAIRLAQLNSDIGQHARAIEILNQRQKGIPFNPRIAYCLADAYLQGSKFDEAMDVVKKLREAGQDSAYMDQLQGRAEYGLRRYREAKTSFELSLKKDPHLPETDNWLKHVTTILGQGDTSNIREPIEAVSIPDDLLKDFSAPAPAASKESSAYLAHRITALSFIPGKEQRETNYEFIKVLDTNGVESCSTQEFDFDPLAESIYVNKLIVRDGEGKTVAQGKTEDYYTVDQGGEIASQQKRLHVPVPGLKPGYTVQLVITRRDHAAPQHPRFKECHLAGYFPCIQSAVVLRGDPALFTIRPSEGARERKIDGGLCWTMSEPPPMHYEHLSPPLGDIAPRVAFSDRSATWPAEARDYISTLSARLIPTPTIKALAQRLTEGLTSDEEKANAILKHVQKDLTYKAIAFGPRARMPQPVDDIVQKRYGDCKDHSLLLHHLLNAAGLNAQLVLAKSYGRIITDEPSLDQFDHMIVYCSSLDRFFDCTTKNLDLARYAPLGLGGSHVLILDALQPRLAQIPKPAESSLDLTRQLQLSETGELLVHDTARITGFLSAGFRAYLRGSEPRRRTEFMQRLVSSSGHDALKPELKIENLEDVDRPLLIDFTYTIADAFKRNGAQLVGAIPAPWDRYYLETQPLEKRETPFEFLAPVIAKSDLTIDLPENYRLRNLPNDFTSSDDFASATLSFTQTGQRLTMHGNWRQLPNRHPSSRYAAFQKSMTNILSSFEPTLILEK